MILATALLLLTTACGQGSQQGSPVTQSPSSSTPRTPEQALPRLKEMIESTASVVAAGIQVEPDNAVWSPTVGCENSVGQGDGTASADYSVKFALSQGTDVHGLFARARSYWQQSGYDVGTVDLAISDPDLHARKDGYEIVLHVVKPRLMAYIEGSTPCLPEATSTTR